MEKLLTDFVEKLQFENRRKSYESLNTNVESKIDRRVELRNDAPQYLYDGKERDEITAPTLKYCANSAYTFFQLTLFPLCTMFFSLNCPLMRLTSKIMIMFFIILHVVLTALVIQKGY